MESRILEFLINDWRQRKFNGADTDALFATFLDRKSTRDALESLQTQGYIKLFYAGNTIYSIVFEQKFKDEFN